MIYILVRIVAIIVLMLIYSLVFKKIFPKLYKKNMIGIIALIIYYILLLIPFENLLIKFHSPIDAFEYTYINQNIIKVIEENNCTFIIYGEDGSSFSYTAFEKQKDGWKIRSPYGINRVTLRTFDRYLIDTYHAVNCNNKLITVSEGNLLEPKSDMIIKDNQNSQFKTFYSKYNNVDVYTISKYTVINSTISDYQLIINGKNIDLD